MNITSLRVLTRIIDKRIIIEKEDNKLKKKMDKNSKKPNKKMLKIQRGKLLMIVLFDVRQKAQQIVAK